MRKFEWDDYKAAANWRDHGITFDQGARASLDPFVVEFIDDREGYGKERFNLLGLCRGVILHVTYTEARRPHSDHLGPKGGHEQDDYFRDNSG